MAPVFPALGALASTFLFLGAAPAAAESVTERQALRLFLEQSPQARRVTPITASADADRRLDARLTNPEIAYQVEDSLGVRDEFLTLHQELPITGRRGLLHRSAAVAASAAGREAVHELRLTTAELRLSFYEVLYQEQVLDRLHRGSQGLQRIVDSLERREREGAGSGYDLLRAQQELAVVALDVAEAEADLQATRSRFGALYAPEMRMESARLEGELLPTTALPEPGDAVGRALSQRSDLEALRDEARSLDLDLRAARRRRFPEPTLSAGWKRTEAPGLDDTGFVASLTVPLPVFDRGRILAARASADRQRTELDLEVRERAVRGEVRAAIARERVSRQAARELGPHVEQRAGELRGIAELAYDEGEIAILELLDTYRSSLAMELRAVAVRYAARRAQIDRQLAVGLEVQP